MAISSVIIQTTLANVEKVKTELADFPEASIETVSPKGEIVVILETDSLDALHAVCLKMEQLSGVTGVYPSYVTTADEEDS